MILKGLIDWLGMQDQNAVVTDGFGKAQSERGY